MNISFIKNKLQELLNWPENSIEIQAVSGGSINDAYLAENRGQKVFIKINDLNPGIEMFKTESDGLEELSKTRTFRIPEVISTGIFNDQAYLLLEWIEQGSKSADFAGQFADRLSKLHSNTNTFYGFSKDNFIGSLPQSNRQHPTWNDFFANERILPITRSLYNSGSFDKRTLDQTEDLLKNLEIIVPEENPALLHGDLWAGNYLVDDEGNPVLIDPAVYYGHREMDLAMMKLFGGFSEHIFSQYNELFPLENNWEERILLFQLYPVLVHAKLFGASYVSQAKMIIDKYS